MTSKRGDCSQCGKTDTRVFRTVQLCWKCDQQVRRDGPYPCACGCGEQTLAEFVSGHNTRLLSPKEQGRRGKFNINSDYCKRGASKNSYIKVNGRHYHRTVMEEKLGRALSSEEIVHHIDEDKHNNHPDNLQVVTRSEHARIHFSCKTK